MKYSTEAIDYQGPGLFNELTKLIEEMKTGKLYSDADIKKLGIEKTIFNATGLNVQLMLYRTHQLNGWCRIPTIKPDHFFAGNGVMALGSGYDVFTALSSMEVGYVDLQTGRVSGFYSKVPITITLTTGLIENMDSDIIAAVLLHEIGHAFTYFEYFNLCAYNGAVISTTARALVGTTDKKKRKDVIQAASRLSGVDYYDNEIFAGKDEEVIQAVLIRDFAALKYGQKQYNLYDTTNAEYIADEFAVKHGGAVASAKFEKIIQDVTTFNNVNLFFYAIAEAAKILGVLTSVALLPIMPIFYIAMVSLTYSELLYEDPRGRVQAMRRQLIESIKDIRDNPRFDREDVRRIYDDIEALDKILSEMKIRPSLARWMVNVLPFSQKGRMVRDRTAYNMLQDILTNDITYQASRFDTLTATRS